MRMKDKRSNTLHFSRYDFLHKHQASMQGQLHPIVSIKTALTGQRRQL